VLNNLQSSTSWQRIYMEYYDQLKELDCLKKQNGTNGNQPMDTAEMQV
jgi:hypothetical protein